MDLLGTLAAVTLGALLGFVGSYLVSRGERAEANRGELRRLLGIYQADVAVAVAKLKELPPAGEPNPLYKAVDSIRGPRLTWASTQRELLRTLGPNWHAPIERVVRTAAQLRLFDISVGLQTAMDAVDDYIIRLGDSREHSVIEEWSKVHSELETQCRNELQQQATRHLFRSRGGSKDAP